VGLNFFLKEVKYFPRILNHCKKTRSVIQAGGNIGVWPVEMSKHFDQVYSAEPHNVNFSAFEKNTNNILNIVRMNVAFGKDHSAGALDEIAPGNIGAYQVISGNDFKIITIDSLGVEDCDLIQLDVEGFEQFALEGAIDTIKKCWPVIVIELRHLGERYGCPDQLTRRWLEDLGYQFVEKIHNDSLFLKNN
jgi:FkbM family methyltransferase